MAAKFPEIGCSTWDERDLIRRLCHTLDIARLVIEHLAPEGYSDGDSIRSVRSEKIVSETAVLLVAASPAMVHDEVDKRVRDLADAVGIVAFGNQTLHPRRILPRAFESRVLRIDRAVGGGASLRSKVGGLRKVCRSSDDTACGVCACSAPATTLGTPAMQRDSAARGRRSASDSFKTKRTRAATTIVGIPLWNAVADGEVGDHRCEQRAEV